MQKNRVYPGHPALWRMMTGLLVILAASLPAYSQTSGMLPSLDTESAANTGSMTTITEMIGAPAVSEEPEKPLATSSPITTTPTPVSAPAEIELTPLVSQPKNGEPAPLIVPPEASQSIQEQPLQPLTPLHPDPSLPTLKVTPEALPAPQATSDMEPKLKEAVPEVKTVQPLSASASRKGAPAKEKPEAKPESATEKKTADSSKPSNPETPASAPKKPFKFSLDVGQAIQNAKSAFQSSETGMKPISYSPLPGIAVFAVVKHGNERVFGDMPVLFAREYAQRLGAKLPETKIYNPIYTVDELRMQGLGHIYDQIMNYYIKTGAPEPTATDYLLKQISTNRPNISRIIFVEADVDFSHPDASTNLLDRAKQLLTDDTPKQAKFFVASHIQIFDAEKPGFPIVWQGSWQRSVRSDQFSNVTPSVYADSDSQQAFARVSRLMSQELIYVTPKDAYMAPKFDTDVEGKLVSGKQPAFPNLPESQIVPKGLSHENKQAIERILQRQNEIGPK